VTHLAACFHTAVAELVMTLAQELHQTTGIRDVVLSGGVFQNMRLLTQAIDLLQREGFHVLIHHQVPPNDGGLALGQAVLAWQRWL
jgi:hydrogenase maturation protein HypF